MLEVSFFKKIITIITIIAILGLVSTFQLLSGMFEPTSEVNRIIEVLLIYEPGDDVEFPDVSLSG